MSDRATTADLMTRLRRHYIKPGSMPGGVFVPECGINGGSQTRCDALYVGFTSASGRILVGHEVKASRADWRKELDTVGKADEWADNCHAWYIVAPSTDIVPVEELPAGWGLLIPNPRTTTRMTIAVKAEVHADRTPSWKMTRSILARLDTLQWGEISRIRQDALEQARTDVREQQERLDEARGVGHLSPEDQQRLNALDALERALGAPIRGFVWGDDEAIDAKLAAASLRVARSARDMGLQDQHATRLLREQAQRLLDGLDQFEHAREALRSVVVA